MAHRKWKEIKQQPGTAGPGNPIRPVVQPLESVQMLMQWPFSKNTLDQPTFLTSSGISTQRLLFPYYIVRLSFYDITQHPSS